MPIDARPSDAGTTVRFASSTSLYDRKRHYVADKARYYDAARTGPDSAPLARHRWQAEMRAVEAIAASLESPTTILDLPCGTGRFFPIFAAQGHAVIGGDVSRDMLAAIPHARHACGYVRRLRCDAERIPLADNGVDVILAMRFWSFLPDDVRRRTLAEWRRVARIGVYVQVRFRTESDAKPCRSSFQLPEGARPEDPATPEQRANWPTTNDFARMTARAGFTIAETIALDWGPTIDPVILCRLQ